MRTRLAILVMGACCWSCGEQDEACTSMGCFDGVEVRLAAPLSASELSVHVQFDDKDVRCEFKTGVDTCKDEGVSLDGDIGHVYGFRLAGQHPDTVTFSFSDLNQVLVSATANPKFVTQQPNGPNCTPTCDNGLVQL
jgi:hypothetical protein